MAMKPRIEKYKKQYPDLDREKKAEVQWLLDDLDRAEDSIKRVDRMVRELIALGQVPKEEKKAAKEESKKPPKALGNAEVHKVVKEFGLDTNDIDLRVKAMKIFNS